MRARPTLTTLRNFLAYGRDFFSGLHGRLLWLALVPTLLSAFLFAGYSVHQSTREAEAVLQQRGRDLASQLSQVAAYDLFTGNLANLQRFTDHLSQTGAAAAIGIADNQGRWWVVSGDSTLLNETLLADPREEWNNGEQFVFIRPVGLDKNQQDPLVSRMLGFSALGRVGVVLTDQPIAAARTRSLLTVLTFLLPVSLLAITMAWTLSRRLARRLLRITDTVHHLAGGQLDARIVPASADHSAPPEARVSELRQLELDINEMASALQDVHAHLQKGIRDATAQLTEQKLAAEAAVRAKSKFLAAASHDLRQPLHALTLLIAALKDKVPDGELAQLTGNIEASAAAMGSMLNGLLDLSRLDAGIVEARPECIALQPIFTSLAQQFAPTAAERGLTLQVHATSVSVHTDPLLLERILMNLISNAIRYTRAGRVVLGVRRRGPGAEIQLLDTGLGIAPELQDKVFEEYFQIDNPERQRAKGLGLGLAIVAREAALLDTRIQLRSRLGHGSCFSLRLPQCTLVADPVTATASSDTSTGRGHFRAVIGVIEDDPLVLGAMRTVLQEWGLTVAAAESAEGLLDALGEWGALPDLILSDYRLPGPRDGIASIAWLRAELGPTAQGTAIPAALITGDTGAETIQLITASGLAILHKPLKPARLRAFIQHALAG